MDHERFDGLVRALGSGATRRGALGVLAGLAGLGLSEVAAKRRHRGRKKGKSRLRAQTEDPNPGNPDKVDLCHYDAETDTFHQITVDDSAVQKHLDNHGDFFPAAENGCCTDADCGENETCVVDEQTNTGSCEAALVCDINDPCFGQQSCGSGCGTVPPVDGGACFCHQGSSCSDLQACDSIDDCPVGWSCANSCCGVPLCLPPCGGAGLRAAGIAGAGEGPMSISAHLGN